jgi:hypothetical protein
MFKQGVATGLFLLLLSAVASAAFRNQILAVDVQEYSGREVLLLRCSHDMSVQSGYNRNVDAMTISIQLPAVSPGEFSSNLGEHSLISGFLFTENEEGSVLEVGLSRQELTSQQHLRISQPSRTSLMLEVFGSADDRDSLSPVVNALENLELGALAGYVAPQRNGERSLDSDMPLLDAGELGVSTYDLRTSEPLRVLALAADSGLLNLRGRVVVETEDIGTMTINPAGQSLANWMPEQPPGEIYLSGKPNDINRFLNALDDGSINQLAGLGDYWEDNKPRARSSSYRNGSSTDTRRRLKDDPHSGLYYDGFSPQNSQLSDIRVTLQAPGGMNLYDVINYLSEISGISIIIDPYAFEEPTGGPRDPKVPEPPLAAAGGPGFRGADEFLPQGGSRGGTFVGNLINVPFDTALGMILGTHNLEYVVYDGSGQPRQSGNAMSGGGGRPQAYGDKPVILVTSPERLNQELEGTNEINLYQFHYADPDQMTDMLDNLGMLPGTDSGWYIYRGGGNGTGSGGGGGAGGGNGGGGNGDGGRGRVGTGFANNMRSGDGLGETASIRRSNGAFVFRGSSRQPVLREVSEALEQGRTVIRLVLRPEDTEQLVTLFAN